MYCTIASLLTCLVLPLSIIKKEEKTTPSVEFRVSQQIHLSDKTGVLNLNSILSVKSGTNIIVFLDDGAEVKGVVKDIQLIESKVFKVFGDVLEKKNASFGFVITAEGGFGGAVIFRDTETLYTVQLSEKLNGPVLSKVK